MNVEQLADALKHPNLQAFLRVIRAGESSQDDSAYTAMFGGEHFTSFADHPRRVITKGRYTSTAAGAYQFLSRTWDGLVRQYGFADFSPASQDLGAVALIAGRGALADALAGRIEAAIAKCGREWASLPGSPYGQPVRTLAQALATYAEFGGTRDAAQPETTAAPAASTPPARPAKEKTMPIPLILGALLPSLVQAIPKLGALFGSGSEVAERNVAAATTVMQIVQDATGARNAQEAVEMIQTDPQALQAATKAVQDDWFTLTEAGGGGIEGARKADADFSASGRKSVESPAFILSLVLLAMPFLLLIDVFFVHPDNYLSELRTQIVTGVLMVISMVGAFWLGSSFGSMKKTEAGARE
jgi:muramidase (phage lysozyme)